MPLFAINSKYTPETLAAARKEGLAHREAAAKAIIEQLGGKLLAFYWLSSPDWDYLGIGEFASADDPYALVSMAMASGAFQRSQVTPLRTSAEADAAIARQLNWTPPGQS